MEPIPWQNVIEQHISVITVLETHASLILDSLNQPIPIETSTQQLLKSRLQKTEDLINFLKESAAALDHISDPTTKGVNREPQSSDSSSHTTQTPLPASSSEPTVDASGLFSVDTNPTPLERLYQPRTTTKEALGQNTKRKSSDLDIPLATLDFTDHQHNYKRVRSQEQSDITVPEVDDSFEREVEAKLKLKEERKRAQDNKKRKRDSDTSATPANGKGPRTKRQRLQAAKQHGKKQFKAQIQSRANNNQPQQKPVETQRNDFNKRSNTETINGGTPPNKKRKRVK